MYNNLGVQVRGCFNLTVNAKTAVKLPRIYILFSLLQPTPTFLRWPLAPDK